MGNDVIKTSNSLAVNNSVYDLSFLLDEQYSMVDVDRVFNDRQNKADMVIGSIMSLLGDLEIGNAYHRSQSKEVKYVVQISDDVQKALDSGQVKFVVNKAGEMFAQVRNANGQFANKLPIKPEMIAQGLDPQAIATYLQMKAIQKQLSDVIATLGEIGNKVSDVLRGQQNDRLALYYSGLNMYYEASHIRNEALQIGLMAQALQSLNEANSQVMKELKDSIDYIVKKKYMSTRDKGKRIGYIKEKMNTINQCFDVIHRSAVIKAMIYYEKGELDAMLAVIEEYGKFIDSIILPNAETLSEHDERDLYLQDGIWENRVKTLSTMQNLREAALESEVFYLNMEEAYESR